MVRLARENFGWGYDQIVGPLANLGHTVSDQTVGNVLRRHGVARTAEKPNDHGGIHLSAWGRPRWHGLFHGRSADLARYGDILMFYFSFTLAAGGRRSRESPIIRMQAG